MAWLGKTFRYILNINTIWGLMILVSLLAAGIQHYVPTTSWIPLERLQPGDNQVVIKLTDKDENVYTAEHTVSFDGAQLVIPPGVEEPDFEDPQPWLKRSTTRAGMPGLVWDSHGYGRYQILVNGQPVAKGNLVTLRALTDAALDYAETAFGIGLNLVAVFVLFLGLMKVGEDAGIVQAVAYLLRPIINFLFPGIPKKHPANGAIVMNITTAILGLGNASTPFGLKAMEELEKLNPRKGTATDAMCMLLGYNTAGFALLPTTMIALRKSAGCSDPFAIIGTCMLAGASSTLTAMAMVKLLGKLPMFKANYTAAELASIEDEVKKYSGDAPPEKEEADG